MSLHDDRTEKQKQLQSSKRKQRAVDTPSNPPDPCTTVFSKVSHPTTPAPNKAPTPKAARRRKPKAEKSADSRRAAADGGARSASSESGKQQGKSKDQSERAINEAVDGILYQAKRIGALKKGDGQIIKIGKRKHLLTDREGTRLRYCCSSIEAVQVKGETTDRIKMIVRPCNQRYICPVCGTYWRWQMKRRMKDDTLSVLKLHPHAIVYFFSISPPKAGSNLLELIDQVLEACRWISKQKADAKYKETELKLNCRTETKYILGGLELVELKMVRAYGKNYKLHFPHVHGVWAASAPIDAAKLQREIRKKFGPGFKIELKRISEDVEFLEALDIDTDSPTGLSDKQQRRRAGLIANAVECIAHYGTKEQNASSYLQEDDQTDEFSVNPVEVARRLRLNDTLRPRIVDPATGKEVRLRAKNLVRCWGVYRGLTKRIDTLSTDPTEAAKATPEKHTGEIIDRAMLNYRRDDNDYEVA